MTKVWENEVRCPRCQSAHTLCWPHPKVPGAVTYRCPSEPAGRVVTIRPGQAWLGAPACSADAVTVTEA